MKIERAIEILTPCKTRFSPEEYEQALAEARLALRHVDECLKLKAEIAAQEVNNDKANSD